MNLEDIKQFLSTEFPHLDYYDFEHKIKTHVFASKLGDYILELKLITNKTTANKLYYRAYKTSYADCFYETSSITPDRNLLELTIKSIYKFIEIDIKNNKEALTDLDKILTTK
jgi:hypothetical protein